MGTQEIWCDINGYEGTYQISCLGNVRNIKTGKQLKAINDGRYLFIQLWKNNKFKDVKIHKLVATAFLPNPNGYTEINHIDENKLNNCVDNLEWCTHSHNMRHNGLNERIAKKSRLRNMDVEYRNRLALAHGAKPFKCIENGKTYFNRSECSKDTGVSRRSILRVLNNESAQAKGYHFEYV